MVKKLKMLFLVKKKRIKRETSHECVEKNKKKLLKQISHRQKLNLTLIAFKSREFSMNKNKKNQKMK